MIIKGLILFGDSVIAGRGVKERKFSCSRILKSILPFHVLIKGRSYIDSREILMKVKKDILDRESIYTHVIILLGNNEPRPVGVDTPSITPDEFRQNLSILVKKIQNSGRCVLVCNLQPLTDKHIFQILKDKSNLIIKTKPSQFHKVYSDVCKEVAIKENAHFIDIRGALEASKSKVISDYCLDPNRMGHRIIANEILKVLKNIDHRAENLSIIGNK